MLTPERVHLTDPEWVLIKPQTLSPGICMWAKVDVNMSDEISLLFHIMWYLKSAVNPVILGGLNVAFRILFKHYVRIVCSCKCENGGLSSGATLRRTQTYNYDQNEKRRNERLYCDQSVVSQGASLPS